MSILERRRAEKRFQYRLKHPRWSTASPPPSMRGGATSAAYLCQNNAFSAAAGAKTVLMVLAPAGHGLTVTEIGVSFDGVTASAVPALVEIVRTTGATAGTVGASPVTPVQIRGRVHAGTAPTVQHNYTVEPTVLTGGRQWYVSPNGGVLIYPLPLGREVECDSSAGVTKGVGIRVTTTATVNVLVYMEVEALA